MKLVKTASGKKTIKISKAEWRDIGKKAGWITAQAEEIYLLDEGVLYDDEAEEVFNMKRLIKYFSIMNEMGIKEIPKFYNAKDANDFLKMIGEKTGEPLGRVLEKHEDPMKTIRYKDTKKERDVENAKYLEQRNRGLQKGQF